MKNKSISCSGKIPIIVLLVLAFASGGGAMLLFSGKIRETTSAYIFILLLGVVLGLFVLPNLQIVIRWMKGVRDEIKK